MLIGGVLKTESGKLDIKRYESPCILYLSDKSDLCQCYCIQQNRFSRGMVHMASKGENLSLGFLIM